MDIAQGPSPDIENIADAGQLPDLAQTGDEIISDPYLFRAVEICCFDQGRLLISQAVKDLIARYAPADRPWASYIPQERRRAFLDELTQITGRPLPPGDLMHPWADFLQPYEGTPPELDPVPPCALDALERLQQAANGAPARAPKIAKDLIRLHNNLIHKLAAPLVGKGKIIVAGFGENPDEVDKWMRNPRESGQ